MRQRHRLVGHVALTNVESVAQMLVLAHRLAPAQVGQLYRGPDGGVVQRECGGASHSAGHVGHAVMHHAIHHIRGVGMGRWPRGFKTTALVNGYVDHHCAGTHPGAGIPGVVGSAKATAGLMLEDLAVKTTA